MIDTYHFTAHSLEDKLHRLRALWRRNPLWRRLHPRPAHVIGLGTAKSGTSSIAFLFMKRYQSLHEVSKFTMLRSIFDYLEGRATRDEFVESLRDDDRRWRPTVNVANYFGEVAGEIADAFPDARFIITVRDCYTWLRSQMSQMLAMHRRLHLAPKLQWFGKLHDLRFGRRDEAAYPAEEGAVREAGLPPVEAMLRYWTAHNERILGAIPEGRRLVIRTPDIARSVPKIAAFAGVPAESLDAGVAHSHKAPHEQFDLWGLVDPAHIERLAARHCTPLMQTYYPEITGVEDALACCTE